MGEKKELKIHAYEASESSEIEKYVRDDLFFGF